MSIDLPVVNPLQATFAGMRDLFVAKISPAGALTYATYLGGAASEDGGTIAVDAAGIALAAAGLLNPPLAALVHVVSEVAFVLNSTRLLQSRSQSGTRLAWLPRHSPRP